MFHRASPSRAMAELSNATSSAPADDKFNLSSPIAAARLKTSPNRSVTPRTILRETDTFYTNFHGISL
jgi:hypothetical protein